LSQRLRHGVALVHARLTQRNGIDACLAVVRAATPRRPYRPAGPSRRSALGRRSHGRPPCGSGARSPSASQRTSPSANQEGSAPAFRRLLTTRPADPQSLQFSRGRRATTRHGGQSSRTDREKLVFCDSPYACSRAEDSSSTSRKGITRESCSWSWPRYCRPSSSSTEALATNTKVFHSQPFSRQARAASGEGFSQN